MSTPLYKRLKARGTSFYAFPSAASDLNLANYNDFYNLNFTKFALLNIPRKEVLGDPIDGVLDLIPKSDTGENAFYCDDPNKDIPTTLSEQLVESLRNYVANYDTSLHESRINSNTDFYNIAERQTPTEHIFWKWCRKLNLIDFEPGVHKVDWDKNLSDFDNPNKSTIENTDYFRKYLWKEREVIYYQTTHIEESDDDHKTSDGINRTPKFTIPGVAKFKVGDKVILETDDSLDKITFIDTVINLGEPNNVLYVEFDSDFTYIWLDVFCQGDIGRRELKATSIHLKYHRLIEYIGEINQITNIQTASRVGQEVTAYIPHQAGRTPTILFGIRNNTNYYPNLEIPILADEIQTEIVGAETLNSPIRTNPQDYPGSHFGQFDTNDNTYLCSNGDAIRYQGDYYGVMLTENTGLSEEEYIEKLTDFNSDNIDGVFLDVDRTHYYKMYMPNLESKNFDEFSSVSIEGMAPCDFDFNAILWYYELLEQTENGVNSYVNLYGIEFLNNPDNDDDNFGNLITPYHKLVTNGSHDGLSYMFNLNLHYNIDNDVEPLTYDPSTIYNMFGFDMYNEMMRRYYQVNENFVNIIQEFVRINLDLQDMKSLIYSQTSMDELKSRMRNMEVLLQLYSNRQLTDSDTAKISVDNSGTYPTLKINVVGVEYDEIKNINLLTAYNYNSSNAGASYTISLSYTNKMLLNLINDNHSIPEGDIIILLDGEPRNKQKLDIIIKPEYAQYAQRLTVNMNYKYNNTVIESTLFQVDLPKDVIVYDALIPENSIFDDTYYLNENIFVNAIGFNTGATWCGTGYTQLTLSEDIFVSGNTIYIQNLYLQDLDGYISDYSGSYIILEKNTFGLTCGSYITINLLTVDVQGYKLIGHPRVSFYKGLQVSILRIDGSDNIPFSEINKKYDISYKII